MMENTQSDSELIPPADSFLDFHSPIPVEPESGDAALTLRERPDRFQANAANTMNSVTGSRLLAGLPPVDSSAPHRPDQAEPRLVVVRGEHLNVTFQLIEGKNYIGRSADLPVDIDLNGQEPVERIWSSRQHAVITWVNHQAILEDLNSLNGTFINRVRLHPGQKRLLQAGDVIQVGTVQLRFLV